MELIIQDYYEGMVTKFYLKEERGSKIVIIGYSKGKLIEQDIIPGEVQKFIPLCVIPIFMKAAFLKAFIEAGSHEGIKTENENLLKGKLEATQLHLSDMRELARSAILKQQ